jgi:hypothetical protein
MIIKISMIKIKQYCDIAGARQIFHKNFFFFSLPGEVFLRKKEEKVFMKNLRGVSNIHGYGILFKKKFNNM